jgi:DNA-directed RNA polymerase specialized sigma24 family protein
MSRRGAGVVVVDWTARIEVLDEEKKEAIRRRLQRALRDEGCDCEEWRTKAVEYAISDLVRNWSRRTFSKHDDVPLGFAYREASRRAKQEYWRLHERNDGREAIERQHLRSLASQSERTSWSDAKRRLHRSLYAALAELPEHQRTAVQLCVGEGVTVTEASRLLGPSERTIRRWRDAALAALAQDEELRLAYKLCGG